MIFEFLNLVKYLRMGTSFLRLAIFHIIFPKFLIQMYRPAYNSGKDIWNNGKKSSKIGQELKFLISTFTEFLTAIIQKRDLVLARPYLQPVLIFSKYFLFNTFS